MKQASSEIAQSRERFEKWYDSESYDDCDSYVHRRMGEAYEQAERDTRERVAQIVKRYAEDGRSLSSVDDAMDGLNELAERIRGKE